MRYFKLGFVGMFFILVPLVSAHMGDMMSGMYGGLGWPTMIFYWIFSILVLVALVLLVIWLIKQIQKK